MANEIPAQNVQEQNLEKGYRIRQVTNAQLSWTEQGRGQAGKFTLQLILDNGVSEYILEPRVEDAELLLGLLAKQSHVVFDQDRKVLTFGAISTK